MSTKMRKVSKAETSVKTGVLDVQNPQDSWPDVRGGFTCVSLNGVIVPCIVRDGKPYGPVRVLENKILNNISSPSALNAAFRSHRLLVSTYLTDKEAHILTNMHEELYTSNDLVVDITEFRKLLTYLRDTAVTGGWIQVNNSVIPYICANQSKYLPLAVVINAAGLLRNLCPAEARNLIYPTEAQCHFMNSLCQNAGLAFVFDTSTALVDVTKMCAVSKPTPYIHELPNAHDPFSQAHFIDETSATEPVSVASGVSWQTNGVGVLETAGLVVSASCDTQSIPAYPVKQLNSKMFDYIERPPQIPFTPQMPQPVTNADYAVNTVPPTVIEAVPIRDRTISSFRRPADNNTVYVLLDAVCRLFFPHQQNIDGFIRAVEMMHRIPDIRLTDEEEREFIRLYRLPSACLRYKRLIRLDNMIAILPRLEAVFSALQPPDRGQLIGTVLSAPAKFGGTTDDQTHSPSNGNNNSDDDRPCRKRRRKQEFPDVVVID